MEIKQVCHWTGAGFYAPISVGDETHEHRLRITPQDWQKLGDNAPSEVARRQGLGTPGYLPYEPGTVEYQEWQAEKARRYQRELAQALAHANPLPAHMVPGTPEYKAREEQRYAIFRR